MVISTITELTDSVSPTVIAPKPNNKICLCVNLSGLNHCMKHEHFPIPPTEETFAKLKGVTVFSKLDVNLGFYQVKLAEDSKKLTTCLKPWGRYYFNRLPFSIISTQEHFQQQCMSKILESCADVVCHMDDIVMWGVDDTDHNAHLTIVFKWLKAAKVTLNWENASFVRNQWNSWDMSYLEVNRCWPW